MATSVSVSHASSWEREDLRDRLDRTDLVRIVLVVAAVVGSWIGHINGLAFAAAVVGGYPIYREAFEALLHRRMTMELSMTIAILAALGIGESRTASVIVLFVLVAEVLEGLTVGRGRRAIGDLVHLLPDTVHVREGDAIREIPSDEAKIGDILLVKPASRVPADGVVTAGHSFVDQSSITGEPGPVEKTSGSRVFAGTVNQSGTLDVRVDGLATDTVFGRIVRVVEKAQASRAPVQRMADRIAGYLVTFALTAAALTLALTRNGRSAIAVVIVAGACGVAAGTPLAILGAIGRCARLGAIVRDGSAIELLWRAQVAVLDKTGTLTLGRPEIVGVHPASEVTPSQLIAAAALAERRSEHPFAEAVLRLAKEEGIEVAEPKSFLYFPGKGVVCEETRGTLLVGNRSLLADHGIDFRDPASDRKSRVFVASEGRFLGSLEVADVVRPQASRAIAGLHEMGLRTILLTGDGWEPSKEIALRLRVDDFVAELLPEDKQAYIHRIQAQGLTVVMLGDGINDGPALAQADVGVAMGSGTELARESADVLLIGDDLMKFAETIRVSRACHRVILQNLVGTLSVDGIGIALAAFGLLSPLLAAFIHVSSELLFILNSTRLLPARSRGRLVAAFGQDHKGQHDV